MHSSWMSIVKNGCRLQRIQFTQRSLLHNHKLSKADIRKRRCDLFNNEVARQNALVRNVEKIVVEYKGFPGNVTLVMNKGLSTPHDCSMHCHSTISEQCPLAEVDGEIWDMHKPLENDCALQFLHFQEANPYYVNKAFWKSMSVLMGSVLESSFKDKAALEICSFPPPNVRSGSFVYDVSMKSDSWTPTKSELVSLSAACLKLAMTNLRYNVLDVKESVAAEIFAHNPFKHSQIASIAEQSKNGDTVGLCKLGDFVDISNGPFINDTSHVGRCSIMSAHQLDIAGYNIYRFQGVALPKCILLNHFAYKIIQERAARFNHSRVPVIEDKTLLAEDRI